jgi:integrase
MVALAGTMRVYRRAKISAAAVRALKPGETVMDSELPGYLVRRQQGDARIYAVRKAVRGQRHYVTIGEDGREGLTERKARDQALIIIAALRQGRDPAAERLRAKGMPTLAQWAETVLVARIPLIKPGTARNYRGFIENHLKVAPIGGMRVDEIGRSDITVLHRSLHVTPRAANMVLTFIGVLLAEAVAAGLLPEGSTSVAKIKRYPERKRERFLTQAEVVRLGAVLLKAEAEKAEDPFAIAAIKLLLLTGCRVSEVLTARWSWMDFERAILTLPDSKTGEKVVHLSPAALEVLSSIPRFDDNPYVIVGRKSGGHFVGLQKVWSRIRRAASLEPTVLPDGTVEPVRIHDLRHSFASFTAADGASLLMIGKLLGHRNPSTTARYAHLVDDPLRRVNDAVGARLAASLGRAASE